MTSTTLIISNDFPPRVGGIESYVRDVCRLLDDDVVVLTSANTRSGPGRTTGPDAEHDAALGFPVVRLPAPLLPGPAVGRAAVGLLRRHRAERVLFGAAAPLSLLAPRLRAAGATRIVALSHGHETWWARLPGSRSLLRRMVADLDVLGVISDWTASRIGAVLPIADRDKLLRLPPPVDTDLFRPQPAGSVDRDQTRRCLAAGRMVRQKGFDALLDAWALVGAEAAEDGSAGVPPELVLVGDGAERSRLERRAARLGIADRVRFTGVLPRERLAVELRSARLFALPVRTVRGGLTAEGLGLVFAEAAASGLPVLVGRSGGAPETVLDAVSGYVVDADDPTGIAARIGELLADPERAREMGAAGRRHATARFGAAQIGALLRAALDLPAGPEPGSAVPGVDRDVGQGDASSSPPVS